MHNSSSREEGMVEGKGLADGRSMFLQTSLTGPNIRDQVKQDPHMVQCWWTGNSGPFA